MKKDPGKLFQTILKLIAKDLKEITKVSKAGQLSPQDAQTLVRYGGLLSDEKEVDAKDTEKQKKNLESKPLEELIKLYQDTKKDK